MVQVSPETHCLHKNSEPQYNLSVSLRILCPQGFQEFSAPLSLIRLELQIYLGWRYTRWDETELLNRVIDSLP